MTMSYSGENSLENANKKNNPLLDDFYFSPFDIIRAEHVRPGIRGLLKQLKLTQEAQLEELELTVEPQKLVELLEKIVNRLDMVWDTVYHLQAVTDMPELRAAIKEVQELASICKKFEENVKDSTKKFEKLITNRKDIEGLPVSILGLAAQTAVSKVCMENKMATVDEAMEFLEKLQNVYWNAAVEDLENLKQFAKRRDASEADDLRKWDIPFWIERLRESKYQINEEELRPYFSFTNVMDGLFNLARCCLGSISRLLMV